MGFVWRNRQGYRLCESSVILRVTEVDGSSGHGLSLVVQERYLPWANRNKLQYLKSKALLTKETCSIWGGEMLLLPSGVKVSFMVCVG